MSKGYSKNLKYSLDQVHPVLKIFHHSPTPTHFNYLAELYPTLTLVPSFLLLLPTVQPEIFSHHYMKLQVLKHTLLPRRPSGPHLASSPH